MIVGLVLAGGASRRLGREKQLLPYAGGTVLSATVRRLLAAPLDHVILVLGHHHEDVRAAAGLPEDPRLRVVVNPEWAEGMAASLRCGLRACDESPVDAVVVALGDQPEVEPEVVARLVDARRAGAPLALAFRGGSPGHPVLFGRELFEELAALRGDVGAREVVRRHADRVVRVEAPPLGDVDTDDDYRSLLERQEPPQPAK